MAPSAAASRYVLAAVFAVAALLVGVLTWQAWRDQPSAAGLGGLVLMFPILGASALAAVALVLFFSGLRRHPEGRSRRVVLAATRGALMAYAGALLATLLGGLASGVGGGVFGVAWFLFSPIYWALLGEALPWWGVVGGAVGALVLSRVEARPAA